MYIIKRVPLEKFKDLDKYGLIFNYIVGKDAEFRLLGSHLRNYYFVIIQLNTLNLSYELAICYHGNNHINSDCNCWNRYSV